MATISIVKGKGNLKHNNRTQKVKSYLKSYDENLKHKNIIIIDRNIEDVYQELFLESLKEFNDKQKRNDRKIKNYYEHITRSKQEKPFYELIVQIDNVNKTEKGSLEEEQYKSILKEYCEEFEYRNPNFKVFQCIGHDDEKGLIHFHIDFIPVSYNNTRGLKTKNSLSGAFEQMGYTRNGFKEWREKELNVIQDKMKEKKLEFNIGSQRDQHLNIKEYKEYVDELKKLENEIIYKQSELNKINLEYTTKKEYISAVDKESDVSMMYPGWAKRSKTLLGKEYVTVPKEKWESKHISANEKSYLKKQQLALESEIEAQQSTKSVIKVKILEKENKRLKAIVEHQKTEIEEKDYQIYDLKYEISLYKEYFRLIVGKTIDTIKDKFKETIIEIKNFFYKDKEELSIYEKLEYTEEKYEELKERSKEFKIDLSKQEKPKIYDKEELKKELEYLEIKNYEEEIEIYDYYNRGPSL